MVAAPFAAVISDRFGRRKGMFGGAVVIIAGAVIATTSKHVAQISDQAFSKHGECLFCANSTYQFSPNSSLLRV